MPLKKGTENISANIGELIAAGHPPEQAAAIAYKYAEGRDEAAGICYRSGGSVLLLLRAGELTWGFPGGGIAEGESPEQAAIRESAEETGHTPATPLRLVDWESGFTTYAVDVDAPFVPTLNAEHLGFVWVPLSALPSPMLPGCAAVLARWPAPPVAAMDARQVDGNGWFEIKDNPISKVGVFPYSGRQLGIESDEIFQVFRPPEELSDPECIASFKLIPWIDEHVMLGPEAQKLTERAVAAEAKGVQGVIGEEVFFRDGTLYANIKAFSSTLAALIAAGKRELSAGYRCVYEMSAGVWEGKSYDAIQRRIRGNHLALVQEGRMGPDVAVMDRLVFSFDATEAKTMAEEIAGSGEMSMADVIKFIKEVGPQLATMQEALKGLTPSAAPAADAEPAVVKDAEPAVVKDEEPVVAAAMDEGAIIKRIAQRDALAKQISANIGAFDHAEMTLAKLVEYGCAKLGVVATPGTEQAALSGYLQAKTAATPAATVALDARVAPVASFITKHLGARA